MLFDETELQELDKVAVKKTVAKEHLAPKPAPLITHWIGIDSVGNITLLKTPKQKGVLTILEVESMDIANQIFSAVKNSKSTTLYSKGNHVIPNWKNVGMSSGFSANNMIQANVWLSKVISELGYEKRNTYKIINEPSDVIKKITNIRGYTPEWHAEVQNEVEEAMRLVENEQKQKQLEQDQALQKNLAKMQERRDQHMADLEQQQTYLNHRRNHDSTTT